MWRDVRSVCASRVWLICLGALACGSDSDGGSPPSAVTGLQPGDGGSAGAAGGTGAAGAAGASPSASGGTEGVGPLPLDGAPSVAWDITGIIGTGQSLSVGMAAANVTPAAMAQPYNNLKLSLGGLTVPPLDEAASQSPELSLVPLVEPIRPTAMGYPSAYPANMYGESPHAAMAAEITSLAKSAGGLDDFVSVHTVVGENGQGMSVINETATETVNGAQTTGRAYAATLFEVRAIARLAAERSQSYGVGAIFLTHGETDAGNANYENDMLQLWMDYNADLSAITGQAQSIPLFTSQQHGIYMYAPGQAPRNTDLSTLLQWRAGLDHPGQIVCVGPKYQYPYATDYLHMGPVGYEMLGEKYAQAFYQHVLLGKPWQPLQPLADTVTRSGAVITVDFEVPVPPLAWDDALPEPHQMDLTEWAQGRGFEVRMGTARLTIASVELVDGDTVQITCDGDVPAGATLGYATTSDGAAIPGYSPRWGKLRDSDPFVGDFTKMAQPNYSVAFELTVP